MYAQVRHPWHTRPVRVIPKGELALLALSTSQYFVYLPLSIQRSQARSKYIHVCSGAPSLAHKACTRYTERRTCAAGSQLPAPSSQLPAPSSQLHALFSLHASFDTTLSTLHPLHPCMLPPPTIGPQGLYALSRKANSRSRLPAPSSQLPAPSSQLPAPSSQLPAPSSQLPAPGHLSKLLQKLQIIFKKQT